MCRFGFWYGGVTFILSLVLGLEQVRDLFVGRLTPVSNYHKSLAVIRKSKRYLMQRNDTNSAKDMNE